MNAKTTTILIQGVRGLAKGEKFRLQEGQTIVIGRSRKCDFSLRRSFAYLRLTPQERSQQKNFQAISRQHCRISFINKSTLEIEDISRHGTQVNGKEIRRVIITDIDRKTYHLLLGKTEELSLQNLAS